MVVEKQKVLADIAKIDAFFGRVDERRQFRKDYYEYVKGKWGK
jgi:hypothetical protein